MEDVTPHPGMTDPCKSPRTYYLPDAPPPPLTCSCTALLPKAQGLIYSQQKQISNALSTHAPTPCEFVISDPCTPPPLPHTFCHLTPPPDCPHLLYP